MKNGFLTVMIMFIACGVSYASFPVVNQLTTSSILEECDIIILKDGKEISAKIIEITPELIKYKKCENQDGPLISIYKYEILMLRYADGSKDILNIDEQSQKIDPTDGGILGYLSIILGLLAWLVLGIILAPASLILAIISLNKDENKVPGIIGLILSAVGLLVMLVALS
jgi:hypothetical protein